MRAAITEKQANILRIVQDYARNHRRNIPISHLMDKLGITLQATYHNLDTLERKGYLRRSTGKLPAEVEFVYTMSERSFLSSILRVNIAAYNFVDAETRDLINKLNREVESRRELL